MTTATAKQRTPTNSWLEEAKAGELKGTYMAAGFTESGSGWELSGPAVEHWPSDGNVIICAQTKPDLHRVADLREETGPLWLAGIRHEAPDATAGKSMLHVWSPLKEVDSVDDARHLAVQTVGGYASRTPMLLELLTACIWQQRGTRGGSFNVAVHDYVRLLSASKNFAEHVEELGEKWGLPEDLVTELLESEEPIEIPTSITPSANYGALAWDSSIAKTIDELLSEPGSTMCIHANSRHRTPLTAVLSSMLAGWKSWKHDTLVVHESQELIVENMLPRVVDSDAKASIVTQRTPLVYVPETPMMKELKEHSRARAFPLN